MTSIPLLCRICSKEPEFSDISHLLTHVASKGHLAQELKAKVRSRQDDSIRQKLDAYDQWYKKHQIERLLSQRLILKESKEATTAGRVKRSAKSPSTGPTKGVKTRKKRAKPAAQVHHASPVKFEEPLIDPQLFWFPRSSPSPVLSPTRHGALKQHDPALKHRYHIPRMCDERDNSTSRRAATASTPSKIPGGQQSQKGPDPDSDDETDYFKSFIRSPTMTAYPDPSELPGLSFGFSPSRTIDQAEDRTSRTPEPFGRNTAETEPMQLPVLKGVKWPGMSIFDSASLEAQRLRNQKKDGSILEQMEQNSVVVEQMERIYWPDGSLKQARLITGNVESSPLKEPTPPPKRQRAKPKKSVLTDISTNAPKQTRRAQKTKSQLPVMQASDLCNISKRALVTLEHSPPKFLYPKTAHMAYDAADDEDFERRLTIEDIDNSGRQAFRVFNDNLATGVAESAVPKARPAKPGVKTEAYPFLHNAHGHQGPSHSQIANSQTPRIPLAPMKSSAGNQKRVQPDGLPWEAQPRFSTNSLKPFTAKEDSENIEPILDGNGRVDDQVSQAHNQRITQRYFAVTGNQPAQFFSSMPPHMEFGGLSQATYHGSTLNLLNPYLRQHHLPPQYPPALFRHQAPSLFASRQDDMGKSGVPVVAGDESGNEAKGF